MVELPRTECKHVAADPDGSTTNSTAALRILVTPPDSLVDLVDYLRRCGWSPEIVGSNAVEASPSSHTPVSAAYLRMELDAYLRVWRALHPGAGAVLLGRAAPERAVAPSVLASEAPR
jgi:hypothetical protein